MLLLWTIILVFPLVNFIESAPTTAATKILTDKTKHNQRNGEYLRDEKMIKDLQQQHWSSFQDQSDQEGKFSVSDTRFRRSPQSQDILSVLLRNDHPDCPQYKDRFSPKCRQKLPKVGSLSPKHISGLRMWKSVNLSGLREGALFAEEPNYLLVRREISDIPGNFDTLRDPFIPPRGRKKSNYNMLLKRNSLESNLFDNTDLFMPQRGKKSGHSKMANFDDIIPTDELFFPNRGKKVFQENFWDKRGFPLDLQEQTLFYPNRGKKSIHATKREAAPDTESLLEAKAKIKKESSSLADDLLSQDLFFPNRGKKRIVDVLIDTPEGGAHKPLDLHNRELLNNFSENHDTFYSDRGRQRFPADTLMTGDFSRTNEPRLNGFSNYFINSGYPDNDADFLDYYNNMLDDNQ
ncbi:uncharacterized protein LOC129810019 isoform X2 [Phlebotomus papatasi]|uniref:uncharacterized protein LOC129810019 isoform X2 n=1 Tax=Phlebotomus papatasi TaxID=29031 RepID=UPI0024839694|nr:uncharacterized protein LOC129810019 isoform X2 [Phlebotomus papatasi]